MSSPTVDLEVQSLSDLLADYRRRRYMGAVTLHFLHGRVKLVEEGRPTRIPVDDDLDSPNITRAYSADNRG